MSRHICTFVSDKAWKKECKRRLDEALDEPELAKKALKALERDPGLRKEIPKPLYLRVLTGAA